MTRDRTGTPLVVDALSAAGLHLDRFDRGAHWGEMCCRPGPTPTGAADIPAELEVPDYSPRRPNAAAETNATALLESLLDDEQLASYRSHGIFWVETPRGRVRLGRAYDLQHVSHLGVTRSLCVVPATLEALPAGDVWAMLLLWLQHDPDRFFRVAVQNPGPPTRDPPPPPRPAEATDLLGLLSAELDRMERVCAVGAPDYGAARTGLPEIDTALAGLGAGHVVLVVGAPGSGKSAFALGSALATAIRAGGTSDLGDPLCEHVVLAVARTHADPQTIARSLLAHDAMVRREDIRDTVLCDAEWTRIAAAVGRLSIAALHIDTAASPTGAVPTTLGAGTTLVVVDAPTSSGGIENLVRDARDMACAHASTVMVTMTVAGRDGGAPRLADLPVDVADHVDAVVGIGAPRAPQQRPGGEIAPNTVAVLKNRIGPLAECATVLVNGWGRFLPVVEDL